MVTVVVSEIQNSSTVRTPSPGFKKFQEYKRTIELKRTIVFDSYRE